MGQPLPFAQGFYVSESLPISAQECVNFYPNLPQTVTLTEQSLFGTPGVTQIAQAGASEFNRGLHVFNSIPYAVNNGTLYRINRTFDAFNTPIFDAENVGTGLFGTKRVIMADNGPLNAGGGAGQLCIVIPESDVKFNAFIFTENPDTLVAISDVDFDGPVSSVVYVDGFFLFTKKNGKKFFISALNNGLAYNALDFGTAEADPDPIRAAFVLNNEVFIYGSETFEPFQNVGGSGFPFLRVEGGVVPKGIDAINSLIELDGNMAWIGGAETEQAAIWLSNGGKPIKISTTAIDNQIRTYSDASVQDAFATTYSQSGALFAIFTFPNERTFVYESVSRLWHTRESTLLDVQLPWRISAIVEAYGELIVGDTLSNLFGTIDRDVFIEFGQVIKRRFVLPPISNNGNPFFMSSIELVGETGIGLITGQGQDPQVRLSYSDDGGKTFSDSITRSFGKAGQFDLRVIWDELGRVPRSRMPRFEVSDPVKWAFYAVEVNVD